jgi:hypothetical protein
MKPVVKPYLFNFLMLQLLLISCINSGGKNDTVRLDTIPSKTVMDTLVQIPQTDTAGYNLRMKALANGDTSGKWPPITAYPTAGALLPFKRIVSYYGNFYSTQMGILGQYGQEKVIDMLKKEVQQWEKADTLTPVVPAIHYIAVTAQARAGKDGKYRARMPAGQIDIALAMAKKMDGIVFLDIQVGLSTLEKEIPLLEEYLKLPQVHLGIDPEYSMKNGARPGSSIGTFDAVDINYASAWLAELVKKNNLPPKILVVHRFTEGMVTNYKKIRTHPEVQIVIDMDGFGPKDNKRNTYYHFIYQQPVQFAGFKLFYKIDGVNGVSIMAPAEVLKLKPVPVYIQYQ